MSPGFAGRHPKSRWVSTLDVGLSSGTTSDKKPKCSLASPVVMLTTGRSRRRPMTAAMSRSAMPSSPTPCSREPAGAASRASRNSLAASRRCTPGHRFAPSPTNADTPTPAPGCNKSPEDHEDARSFAAPCHYAPQRRCTLAPHTTRCRNATGRAVDPQIRGSSSPEEGSGTRPARSLRLRSPRRAIDLQSLRGRAG